MSGRPKTLGSVFPASNQEGKNIHPYMRLQQNLLSFRVSYVLCFYHVPLHESSFAKIWTMDAIIVKWISHTSSLFSSVKYSKTSSQRPSTTLVSLSAGVLYLLYINYRMFHVTDGRPKTPVYKRTLRVRLIHGVLMLRICTGMALSDREIWTRLLEKLQTGLVCETGPRPRAAATDC